MSLSGTLDAVFFAGIFATVSPSPLEFYAAVQYPYFERLYPGANIVNSGITTISLISSRIAFSALRLA